VLKTYKIATDHGATFFAYLLSLAEPAEGAPLVLYLPGSGWQSVLGFAKRRLGPFVRRHQVHIATLDKVGICPTEGTSPKPNVEFFEFDYKEQRVADALRTIDFLVSAQRVTPTRLLVMGYSEGVDVAARVARLRTGSTHPVLAGVVLIGGGCSAVEEIRLGLKRALRTPLATINRITGRLVDKYVWRLMSKVLGNPSTQRKFLGLTFKRWCSYSATAPIDDLLQLRVPVLSLHGERDTNAPIESTYYIRDRFRQLGRSNYTLEVYPGLDHSFRDACGDDHLMEVLGRAFEWMLAQEGSR
jgi:dienelactone hydrolase